MFTAGGGPIKLLEVFRRPLADAIHMTRSLDRLLAGHLTVMQALIVLVFNLLVPGLGTAVSAFYAQRRLYVEGFSQVID